MSDQPGIRRRGLVLIVALLGTGIAFAVWAQQREGNHQPPPEEAKSLPDSFPVPPFSESSYLNVGPNAHHIGSEACASCHANNHKSYLRTPHSHAFSDIDPKAEPPDGAYDHAASGRSYRIYRKDGQLRHEEVLKGEQGKEIAKLDLPVRYLIGSGHYTRSYLVEVGGFLHESPITWYESKRKWDMSPGYDSPRHVSFERPTTIECLACHTGRVEEQAGAVHRMTFREKAIGCENCHGPGSLHQALYRSGKSPPGETDLTIVNPGKLTRVLQESICATCHLSSPALIAIRGRGPHEFRPGRPLSDYRIHYQFAGGNDRMTVVGHVEQLRQSACYQKSADLTCVSCHDPHRKEDVKDKVAFNREKCMSCHTKQTCKLDANARLKKENDCVACHMPRGDTEIPHVAFTHHRIGRHSASPPARSREIPELEAADDTTFLDPVDRQRNLGLAYLKVSRNPAYAPFATTFRQRAMKLLEAVYSAGVRDPVVDINLADLYWDTDPSGATQFAKQVLKEKTTPNLRAMALTVTSKYDFQARNYPVAIESLEELVRMRHISEDWRLLASCYFNQNDLPKALSTFKQALAIRPYRSNIYEELAEVYTKQGDSRKADEALETAKWLKLHRQN